MKGKNAAEIKYSDTSTTGSMDALLAIPAALATAASWVATWSLMVIASVACLFALWLLGYGIWRVYMYYKHLIRQTLDKVPPDINMMLKMKQLLHVDYLSDNPDKQDRWQQYLSWIDKTSPPDWWKLKINGQTAPISDWTIGPLAHLVHKPPSD